jgi:hypothetical protein
VLPHRVDALRHGRSRRRLWYPGGEEGLDVVTDDPGRELRARLRETAVRPREIADLLDGLAHPARVAAVRTLGRSEQRALYRAVDGFRPLHLADLVPARVGEFEPVRHFGRNTLPLFTHFEKRFCRPRGADREKPDELYGFNFQTLQRLTGPGYFVAHEDPRRPEVWIDYTRVPGSHPEGWPPLRSNEQGLARLVYGFMVDTLRGVSEHVTIGSAARKGRDIGSWFVLCREP